MIISLDDRSKQISFCPALNFEMHKIDDAIYFDIPVNVSSALEHKIAEVFATFDHNSVNVVEARDAGSILRFLGCAPSEEEIEELVKETEFPDHPGNIHLSRFIKVLKKRMANQKMKPAQPEALHEAFKLFDPNNKGFIAKDDFVKIMTEHGEPMSKEELALMMKSAVNPNDGRVHYESYLNQLAYEPEDSNFRLAQTEVQSK